MGVCRNSVGEWREGYYGEYGQYFVHGADCRGKGREEVIARMVQARSYSARECTAVAIGYNKDMSSANPLFEEWRRLSAAKIPRGEGRSRKWFEWLHQMRQERDVLVGRYSWAVPTNRAIGRLARLGPLVEIGAGNGYWASLIEAAGGDIIAFDKAPTHQRANAYCDKGSYFDVQKGGPEVLLNMRERILFLCWPPAGVRMASTCLKAFLGDQLVYVGEERSGCTGDDAFFDLLEAEWVQVGRSTLAKWPRIHDDMFIYRRKSVMT
jgi:hypothetical protein